MKKKQDEAKGCKCSGSKTVDPSAIRLDETDVDFIKVEKGNFTHYCFDGINLSKNKILHNIIVGQGVLQDNDQLVVSSRESILNDIKTKNNFCAKECKMEDNNYYTVIYKEL